MNKLFDLPIIGRIVLLLRAILIRLLPLKIKLDIGWQLTNREQQRMIQNLLKKADCHSPYAGKRVLFWETGGMPPHLIRHGVIATALRARGAEVHLTICDGAPLACIRRETRFRQSPSQWGKSCPRCFRQCASTATSLNMSYQSIGNLVSNEQREKLRSIAQGVPADELYTFRYRNVDIGSITASSLIRYLKGIPMEGYEEIGREYLYGSLVYTDAAITAIERFKPDRLVMTHGYYIDYGTALAAATNASIPVTHWGGSYVENHYYMRTVTQNLNSNRRLLSEAAWCKRRKQTLTQEENERLDTYLKTLYSPARASELISSSDLRLTEELREKMRIPPRKPVWCIFTHLSWDAVFNSAPMAYDKVESWLLDTIQTIIGLPEITWLVKIHPAECITDPTLYGMQRLIEDNFLQLPPHIRIIAADSDINTYDLYPLLDGAVTVFGTPGLELALLGKPVIVSGEAHYAKKGFTYDGLVIDDYRALLRKAAQLPTLSHEQKTLARQYAYSYFIQRQIPLRILKDGYGGTGPLDFRKLDLLLPGNDKVLDMICERIIEGGDFIMDEDMVEFYSALKQKSTYLTEEPMA